MEIAYKQGIISPKEVIRFLSLTGQVHPVCLEIIKNMEVKRKAKELGITASDEELQEFADNYRMTRGLCSCDEMLCFLKNAGMSEDDFEEFCESSVLASKLKNHLADEKRIKEHFINKRAEYDVARISVMVVRDESLAKELMMQVTEDGEDFHKLARKYSLDENTRHAGGYAGAVTRRMLSPNIAAKVFAAGSGDIVGPFKNEDSFQITMVEEVIKAELNANVREIIRERIFREWLCQFLKGGLRIIA